jgi:eukaryotic-like serine/threonine-protein kinase
VAVAAEALPRIFGRYTLLERLGQGGMAEVLLARQEGIEGTHRLVAIKRILPGLASDDEFVDMFLDEVRIVLGLHHPNIGHILDVGKIEKSHFLAMEYIQGRDLASVLRGAEQQGGRVPLEIAVEIGRQVCAALHHAHTRTNAAGRPLNIVHRDITPDNVIATFDGGVKLVDFGIATAENRMSSTRAGLLKGKPPYMAPEQILGLEVDGRADLFSLGVLLYRLTTRVHPFSASSPDKTFRRIVEETPLPPTRLSADYPKSLSDVVMRALSKDPKSRFESAQAFSDALGEVAVALGSLPSPRRMSRWITALFPQAAAARDRALANPEDNRAAIDASYLSVSAALEGEDEWDPDDGVPTDSGILTRPALKRLEDSGARNGAPSALDEALDDDDEALDDHDEAPPSAEEPTVIHTAVLPNEDQDDDADDGRYDEDDPRYDDPAPYAPDPRDLRSFDEDPSLSHDARPEPTVTASEPVAPPPLAPPAPPSPPPPPAAPRSIRQALRSGGPATAARTTDETPWSLQDHWDHLPPVMKTAPVLSGTGALLMTLLVFAALGIRSCF